MKIVSLFSGGKDSLYATYVAQQYGWEVIVLVSMIPTGDSWMFHKPNIHLTSLASKALGIPILQRRTSGKKEEELKDLEDLLSILDVDGVVSGAIASEYQRTRIEQICHRLGMKSFTPIWHKDQKMLLREMIEAGFVTIITAVSALGFDEKWLGREIDKECYRDLIELHRRYKINVSGEGGEFETLVLDCPIFSKKIFIEEMEKKWEGNRGAVKIKKARLVEKLITDRHK